MTETTHETSQVPPWIHDVKFCHISCDDENLHSYCGCDPTDGFEGPTCVPWDGEAICPTCGNPVCPRCAQLADLEERAES